MSIFVITLATYLGFNFLMMPMIEKASLFPAVYNTALKTLAATPADRGLNYETVAILTSDNVSLVGWYLDHPESESVLLYFHGNNENIGDTVDLITRLYAFPMDILVMDYRQYGLSEGRISEKGIRLDTQAAYDFLTQTKGYRPENINVMGHSLGANVAIQLCAVNKVNRLISISSFSTAKAMVQAYTPGIFHPFIWTTHQMAALEVIGKVNAPILIAHSPDDEITPYEMSSALYEAANEPKARYTLKGAHNDVYTHNPLFFQALNRFLNEGP